MEKNVLKCRFADLTYETYDTAIEDGLSHEEAQRKVHDAIGEATREEVRLVNIRNAYHSDFHKMS